MAVKSSFKDRKVYYSGSIKGASELEPDFAWNLVQYMKDNGAVVLSEHVAARSKNEMGELLNKNVNDEVRALLNGSEPWIGVRKQDLMWVDEATHVVALINAPSHGVGIEIEHAILKPRLGLNLTPILCLIHESLADKASFMVRGVAKDETPYFYFETYIDFASAKSEVYKFLTK